MIRPRSEEKPLISILMPSYGYGTVIEPAVASALGQSYPHLEVVVQDGGSRDATVPVLKRLSQADARVKWDSRPDGGQSDALNKALRRAGGEWIGWLNADEFYLPGTIEHVVGVIQDNPGADVVYGDFYETDFDGYRSRLVSQHGLGRRALRRTCFIPTCTTFIRREILGTDPWDRDCVSMMDWDLFLGLANRGHTFLHTRVPLAGFRIHQGQVTRRPDAQSVEEFRVIRERHGIPTSAIGVGVNEWLGRFDHVARKVLNGGYARERRVRGISSTEPLDAGFRTNGQ